MKLPARNNNLMLLVTPPVHPRMLHMAAAPVFPTGHALRTAPARPRMLRASAPPRTAAARCFLDQVDAGNLAGPLFGSSLLPYCVFLYFICQDVNRLHPVAKAGFSLLLTFVFATIVSSIVAVKVYGTTLANVDRGGHCLREPRLRASTPL
jgi:hypothetical protein